MTRCVAVLLFPSALTASLGQVKQSLLHAGFKDNEGTHVLSVRVLRILGRNSDSSAQGLGAGFVAVCVGSPVDVVKSRVMGDKAGTYNGMIDCFTKTYAKEGLSAFYKGFLPNFARLGSWNVVMFLSLGAHLCEWSYAASPYLSLPSPPFQKRSGGFIWHRASIEWPRRISHYLFSGKRTWLGSEIMSD